MNKKKTAELEIEVNWRRYVPNVYNGKVLYYIENGGTKDFELRKCRVVDMNDEANPDNILVESMEGRFEGMVSMPASNLYGSSVTGLPITLDFSYDIPSEEANKKFYDLYYRLWWDLKVVVGEE